jgi:hypothetical protein
MRVPSRLGASTTQADRGDPQLSTTLMGTISSASAGTLVLTDRAGLPHGRPLLVETRWRHWVVEGGRVARAGPGAGDHQPRGATGCCASCAGRPGRCDLAARPEGPAQRPSHGCQPDRPGHLHQAPTGFATCCTTSTSTGSRPCIRAMPAVDRRSSPWPNAERSSSSPCLVHRTTICRSPPGAWPSWPSSWSPRVVDDISHEAFGCCSARRACPSTPEDLETLTRPSLRDQEEPHPGSVRAHGRYRSGRRSIA